VGWIFYSSVVVWDLSPISIPEFMISGHIGYATVKATTVMRVAQQ